MEFFCAGRHAHFHVHVRRLDKAYMYHALAHHPSESTLEVAGLEIDPRSSVLLRAIARAFKVRIGNLGILPVQLSRVVRRVPDPNSGRVVVKFTHHSQTGVLTPHVTKTKLQLANEGRRIGP